VTQPAGGRCWLIHQWGPWTLYDVRREVTYTEPALTRVREVTETRQRRRCKKCGRYQDRFVREGPMGVLSE
jgi:hypothetical protein